MKAIVNLSTDRYKKGRERLQNSLQGNFDGDVFIFNSCADIGSPSHEENPYAFKIYAVEKIREMGYDQVLWLDASAYAIKNVNPIFEWLDKNGIFMEAAGHWTGSWSNQGTLDYFGITRDEAMQMPMYSAGFSGFDFKNPISVEFFEKWKNSMLAGCFKGSWSDHRHDMTCGSIIASKMGLVERWSGGGNFFAYIGEVYGIPKESVIFYVESGQ